jgi:hypothetical protein
MQHPFSVIIPYRGTPAVTRVALHALQLFSTTAPEIILVHHQEALSVEEEIMLGEFPELRRVVFPTTLSGSAADIACLDQGVAAASHAHVVLMQGDTIFLKRGWNEEIFPFMEHAELDAIGTQAAEANPCRVWYRRFGDILQEVFHKRQPDLKNTGPLQLHFLVSKKSALEKMNIQFQQQKSLEIQHFLQAECKLNLFSMQEVTSILWHIPHTIPLLRGELHDQVLAQDLWAKWRTFWTDPFILDHFAHLSDGMEQAFRNIAALQQR